MEITIRILSESARITDIRKISIRGYISAYLCCHVRRDFRLIFIIPVLPELWTELLYNTFSILHSRQNYPTLPYLTQIEAHSVGTNVIVSSEQCEIEWILLGMEMAIQYIKETNIKGATDSIYIFCDCQRATDIFVRHGWLSRHPEILEECWVYVNNGRISHVVKLVKIFGHVGITGNAIADREAKEAAKKIVTGKLKASATISVEDARKSATEIAMRSWQRQ